MRAIPDKSACERAWGWRGLTAEKQLTNSQLFLQKGVDKNSVIEYTLEAVRNAVMRTAVCGLVAQLDRVFDYESKGRRFESCRAHSRNPCKSMICEGFSFLAKGLTWSF